MSEGRKGLHGRVIKSLSVKETQKDEERKGENPETIFDSDSPTVHTTKERYGLSDLVKGKAAISVCQNDVCLCVCVCEKEIERAHAFFIYLVS